MNVVCVGMEWNKQKINKQKNQTQDILRLKIKQTVKIWINSFKTRNKYWIHSVKIFKQENNLGNRCRKLTRRLCKAKHDTICIDITKEWNHNADVSGTSERPQ